MLWALRIVGAVLAVGSTAAVGNMIASNYASRPGQLRQLQSGLQVLQTEIFYTGTPLPDAFGKVASAIDPPINLIFARAKAAFRSREGRTAAEIWRAAVAETYPVTALSRADRGILETLGNTLGVSDRDDQLKHISLAMEQLKKEEAKAAEERAANERLWRYFGVLVGLLLVVLAY